MTSKSDPRGHPGLKYAYMFRSWGAIGSPIFAEIEGGRSQNGTFLGDFTWNDPYADICCLIDDQICP